MKTLLALACCISWSAYAQLGAGINNNTAPGGAGTVLTPTSSVNQPAGGSGPAATTSQDITPADTRTNDPAGLRTSTGTDLTPTQGQQTGTGIQPSGTISSPLTGGNIQAEEIDYSTLPSSSGSQNPPTSGSGSGTGSGSFNSTDPTNTAE